jgi:hypothetical protein
MFDDEPLADPNDLMVSMFDALADFKPEAARRLALDLIDGMHAGGPPPDGLQVEEAERFARDILASLVATSDPLELASLALDAVLAREDQPEDSTDFIESILASVLSGQRPAALAAALHPANN